MMVGDPDGASGPSAAADSATVDTAALAAESWEDGGGIGAAPEPTLAPEAADDGPAAGTEPRLTRLTEPGCCTLPDWSADGRSLLFIDRPDLNGATGIWSVSPVRPGEAPQLVTEDIARYSDGMAYRFERSGDTTEVIRLADDQRWQLPTASGSILISPDGQRTAWQESPPDSVPSERRTARVWGLDLAGGEPREVATLPRGGLSGWLANDTLLLRGRDSLSADDEVLWALSLADGERREIARGTRLRGELPSPDGRWVAYYVTQQEDPAANGLWLAGVDGGAPRRLDDALFGAYAWRDTGRLLIVPLDASAPTHRLVELDAATLAVRELVDSAVTPFTIANGDWTVSPDGRYVAFVEQRDKAIWVLELP